MSFTTASLRPAAVAAVVAVAFAAVPSAALASTSADTAPTQHKDNPTATQGDQSTPAPYINGMGFDLGAITKFHQQK